MSTIPNSDDLEWKEFVKSGEKYKNKIKDSEEVCIYCRQPLNNSNSIKLVAAYGEFLKDESERKLNSSLSQVQWLKSKVEAFYTELKINDNLRDILQKIKCENSELSLYQEIISANSNLTAGKELLFKRIKKEDCCSKIDLSDAKRISEKLTSMLSEIKYGNRQTIGR